MKNLLIVILLIIIILSVGAAAYFYGKSQSVNNTAVTTQISPTAEVVPTVLPTEIASPTAQMIATGTVTGKLCYPASMIPKGVITAKNVATSQVTTQNYPGTQNGGSMSYTLSLAPGTYHLKFAPTDYPTVVGFYTDYSSCVDNPSGVNCSGQKTRPLLPVEVKSGSTASDVNLCDFYYPPDAPPVF